MITCPACSKQNQDHYRFCLGCGAELPRGGDAAKAQESSEIADESTSLGVVPADRGEDAPVALPPGKCPECGYVNPPTNRFCASCGFRLEDAAKVAPTAAAVEDDIGAMLVALDPEGNEVGRHALAGGTSTVGRDTGGVFATDTFLSPRHATFEANGGRVTIRDESSLNGVFRKLIAEQRAPLAPGQRFRIGQELLQYDSLDSSGPDDAGVIAQGSDAGGIIGRVSLVVGRETVRPSYPLPERGLNLGRERGEVLFPEDGYVSGLHCHISCEAGEVYVTDLGSSNGTFVQLLGETVLHNGDVLLMGQQLFRITI